MQQDTGPGDEPSRDPSGAEQRATSAEPDTATGLEPNVAGALCYLLGIITGVLFLVLEKDKPFVRFHAFQSIGVTVGWVALSIAASIIGVVPFIGWIIGALLGLVLALAGLILWVYLMYMAFSGKQTELPFIGPWAREQAGR